MKKALTEILRIPTKDQKSIYISIVQKQSQLGLTFNQRLFILVEGDRFGYLSKFKESDKPEEIDVSKCKASGLVKDIIGEVQISKEVIGLKFYQVVDRKKVEKKWTLKMATEALAKQWKQLLSNQKQKASTRRNHSGSKMGSEANKRSDLKNVPKSPSNRMEEVRDELKKDFGKQKSHVGLAKEQYKNELYETENKAKFILTEEQQKRPQPKQKEVARKLNYERETPERSRIDQQAKRAEEERLRREKEELARKERELREMENKIREEQRRIQDEKRQLKEDRNQQERIQDEPREKVKNPDKKVDPERKEVTVINENFFHQNKPGPVQEPTPPLRSGTKSKPKLQGVNYSQFVNKVIFSKNNDAANQQRQVPTPTAKARKIQEVHDYLFQLQKLKVKIQDEPQKNTQNKPENLPMSLGWTYRYLTKDAEGQGDEIIEQFNFFCSAMLKQVVHQLHLPERRRQYLPKYKRQEYFLYEKNDIEFKIAFIGLKEVYSKNDPDNRDSICDNKSVKMLENQFRNYKLIHQASKQANTVSLRVPLVCLCEYQGFVALFKAQSQFDNQTVSTIDRKVQIDLQRVSEITKISLSTLKNKDSLRILKLNNQFYRQLASQSGRNNASFDFHLVDQIKNLMPTDVLFSRHPNKQNLATPDGNQNSNQIRPELLLLYDQKKDQITDNVLLRKFKPPKSPRTSNAQLEKLSQNVLIPITNLIKQLDELAFTFIHPKELQEKLHSYGINMRYLGLIYQNCTLKFQKIYLMSQIAARVARTLFRKTIQDYTLKQTQQLQKDSYALHLQSQIIDFLNWLLGSTLETVTIWKVLSLHALDSYNIPLQIDQIQKGYFVHALVYHCGVQVQWSKVTVAGAFVSNQFFGVDSFVGVGVRVRGYEPWLGEEERGIVRRMVEEDPLVFKLLEEEYSLQTKELPLKFRHPKYIDIFRKYLSNFIPPDIGIHRGYKLLHLYEPPSPSPTKTSFSLQLMSLKWHLKRQRKQKYINAFSELNSQITSLYGDFHPLLSQLYQIMCIYHRNNGEYEDAITFMKSSVINMLKVCGPTHQRVGECYYQLAMCCIKGGKKQQAIVSLQKAKSIFEANEKQYDVSYAHVCLKLSLLFLSEAKTQQAQNTVKFALSLFNNHLADNIKTKIDQTYESQRVECFEILSRCYQLNQSTQNQQELSLQCQKQMTYIKSPSNFQKILKIVLYPILSRLKSADASTYIDIISQIPLQISVSTYMRGYERLFQRVDEGTLIESLSQYTENIKSIEAFMKENKSLVGWKGLAQVYERETVNDFISLTEELIYFLGEGFLAGALRDSL